MITPSMLVLSWQHLFVNLSFLLWEIIHINCAILFFPDPDEDHAVDPERGQGHTNGQGPAGGLSPGQRGPAPVTDHNLGLRDHDQGVALPKSLCYVAVLCCGLERRIYYLYIISEILFFFSQTPAKSLFFSLFHCQYFLVKTLFFYPIQN
jgi:hypothetical protein